MIIKGLVKSVVLTKDGRVREVVKIVCDNGSEIWLRPDHTLTKEQIESLVKDPYQVFKKDFKND